MPIPEGYKFPDLSRYRRVEDWNVYARTYPVSACKATEGVSHKDPYFPAWRAQMRSRGLLPIAYHFLRRGMSIAQQVTNYLDTADDGADFGVMLDLETAGDGSNPTVDEANAWFREVERRTSISVRNMMLYTSRWWYAAFGGGDSFVNAILWNAHYSLNPNISPFAGQPVEIIQYSSTAPIAGLAAPGTGDMNSAIGMTAQGLAAKILGTAQQGELSMADAAQILAAVQVVREKVEAVYNLSNEHHGEAIRNTDTEAGKVLTKLAEIERDLGDLDQRVQAIGQPVVQIDAAAVAEALKPLLGGVVQAAVDAELDKRNISLRTDD